jgi:Zn-dependent peptidase ImmA (M78 family)/transcriptional regulator with XRE-family HTH domain
VNVAYIESLREQRGLSQTDLAGAVGVTRQTIAVWEKGERLPSVGQLSLIAVALEVPLEVFFAVPNHEPNLLFRADNAQVLTPALKALVLQKAKDYAEIESLLGEVATTPPVMPLEVYQPTTVEHLASQVRDFLSVENAPLGDVIARLEDRGLKILEVALPKAISGFSALALEFGAIIVVNSNHPVERRYFTALHELAHLICHHKDFAQPSQPSASKPREDIANHLAGAVLLPREILERELRSFAGKWLPEALLRDLKTRYSVSLRTIVIRAEQLGIISKKQCGQQLGVIARDHPEAEPVQLERQSASSRLERMVFQALSLEKITTSRAAEVLGQSLTDIRQKAHLWLQDTGSAL